MQPASGHDATQATDRRSGETRRVAPRSARAPHGARIRAGADTPIAPRAAIRWSSSAMRSSRIILVVGARGAARSIRSASSASMRRSAGERQGRQHSARARHARHRRPARARRRHRSAVGVHRRRARAEGARGPQIRRIPVRARSQPARVVETIIEGKVVQHLHDPRRADVGADRRAARRDRFPRRQRSARFRAKARCCPKPTTSRAARRASR